MAKRKSNIPGQSDQLDQDDLTGRVIHREQSDCYEMGVGVLRKKEKKENSWT